MRGIFPGRHNIWWTPVAPCTFFVAGTLVGEVGGWTPVAPCNVNDVSIRFICHEDQSGLTGGMTLMLAKKLGCSPRVHPIT